MIQVRAHGKINLTLDVLGKRQDNYHEVKMIMQEIGLYDLVDVRRDSSFSGIELLSDIPGLKVENNLAYKAAKLLMDKFALKDGVHIEVIKRIPIAAGLAGGSADAAGVIIGMNDEFGLKMTTQEMCTFGEKIGSDVPFCICGGTMLAEGRGEILTRLPSMPEYNVVLAKPQIEVATAWAYAEYDNVVAKEHPDTDKAVEALKNGDIKTLCGLLCNVLENVTERDYREIKMIKEVMIHHGAMASLMSGSGPTVFGLFDNLETAENVVEKLENLDGVQVILTKTVCRE